MTNTKYSHCIKLIIAELTLLWQDGLYSTGEKTNTIINHILNEQGVDNVCVRVSSLGSGEFDIKIEEKLS